MLYIVFLSFVSLLSYNKNLKLHRLTEEKNKLKNANKKLVAENKDLKKIRDREKTKKRELKYSNSWKMTKGLRKAANLIRLR